MAVSPQSLGVNHASGLPSLDNKDLQVLLGTRLSSYVIAQYRRTLPVQLFLHIDMDISLCETITYLCEDNTSLPILSDSALDTAIPRQVIKPPRTVTVSGFVKSGFRVKFAVEQMECIQQNQVLSTWYQTSLNQAIEDGKQSLMARFYRHLLTNGVHPKNTGLNAGLVTGGNILGEPTHPVWLKPDTVDVWHMALVNTTKQMPRVNAVTQEFGASTEGMFLFGPPELESLYMKNDNYNSWNKVGDCASCALFKDVFDRMPRGIMPLTSYCVESRTITAGGNSCKVYPVLFGRRYLGSKAALRVSTDTYPTNDRASIIFSVDMYWNVHTYDSRMLGLSWVTIDDTEPQIKACD